MTGRKIGLLARLIAACLLIAAAVPGFARSAAAPVVQTIDSGWQVRMRPGDPNIAAHRAAARWLPASVSGSVQTDLMAARLLADPWKGEGERAAQWVGLSDWQYRKTVSIDAATLARKQVDLVFEGLDTFATVRINGVQVLAADNMFRRWRIAAKTLLRPGANLIEVDIASPIRKLLPVALAEKTPLPGAYDTVFGDEPKGRQTANYIRKSGYHYGWDWAPRLVVAGIWKPVRIEAYDGIRLSDLNVRQVHLDDGAAVLDVNTEIMATTPRTVDVNVTIVAPDGARQTMARRVTLFAGTNMVTLPARIEKPRRWWPVGYGAPDLYRVETRVSEGGVTIGEAGHSIGLRTVELRRDRDQWGRGMALVVNGIPIFAKGANLEPSDSFPTRVPQARLDAVLEAAVAANMNLLRIWGGGYYPDDGLYEKADRLGLMLWQDFGFGNSIPPADPAYHANVRVEATEQVRRLRDHPSLVLWCGNNEIATGWENWSDRKAFKAALGPDGQEAFGASLRRLFDKDLRGIVETQSPGTPYWASSPSADYDGPPETQGDGDVHYWDVWARSPLDDYRKTTPRFMSEFGLQSMPGLATTRAFLAPRRPEDLPVQLAGSGYDSGAGNGRILKYLRADYGEPRSFIDYIYLSQLLQAEGLEMAVIHQRMARPQNMGTLYWTLNDVWPGQINSVWAGQAWGSIDFYNRWKASHYRARRFYAPVTIGAERVDGVTTIRLISDKVAPLAARWRVRVIDRDGRTLSERGGQTTAAPLAATPLARMSDAELVGKADPARTVAIAELIVDGTVTARQFVYFVHAKDLALVDPALTATVAARPDGRPVVTVKAASLARGVWVEFGDVEAVLSDNAFDLAAGDTVQLTVTGGASIESLRRALTVRSFWGSTAHRD